MANTFLVPIQPDVLDRYCTSSDRLEIIKDINFKVSFAEAMDYLRPYLDRLPLREQDLIELYFHLKKDQTTIGLIFDISQSAVSIRLGRLLDRLHFMLRLPVISKEDIELDLFKFRFDDINISILYQIYNTTCQTEAADTLGLSTGCIRIRFNDILQKFVDWLSTHPDDIIIRQYYQMYYLIKKNFNMLRETKVQKRFYAKLGNRIDLVY